jgi:hypothetical protein
MNKKIFFIFIILAGCAPIKKKRDLAALEPAVLQFYSQLKWYRGTIAKAYIHPKLRPAFLDAIDAAAKDIKISDIKVIRITPVHKKDIAKVRLRVVWFHKGEMIVHNSLVEDTWKMFGKNWMKIKSKVIKGKKVPILFMK